MNSCTSYLKLATQSYLTAALYVLLAVYECNGIVRIFSNIKALECPLY